MTVVSGNEESLVLPLEDWVLGMGHDLKTPIGSILGINTLLASKIKDPELSELIERSNDSAKYLLHLVMSILELAKFKGESFDVRFSDFSLAAELSFIRETAKSLLIGKAVTFELDVDETAIDQCRFDATKIRQILMNLVSNACKFTKEGSVTLSVKTLEFDDERRWQRVRFSVIDTGRGMSDADLEHVFERFYTKGTENLADAQRGSGLGMYISSAICQLFGSELNVNSTLGEGSCFYFDIDLPVTGENVSTAARTTQVLAQRPMLVLPQDCLKGLNVYVVDDAAVNCKIASKLLSNAGATVTTSVSANRALEELVRTEKNWDAVLIDLQMPEMDGAQFAQKLSEVRADLPLFGYSAEVPDSLRHSTSAFISFVDKPVDPVALKAVLIEHRGVPDSSEVLSALMNPPGFEDIDGIDVRTTLENVGYDSSLLTGLISAYIDNCYTDTRQLRAALERKSINYARFVLKRIVSMADMLGAHELHREVVDSLKRWEDAAPAESLDDDADRLDRIIWSTLSSLKRLAERYEVLSGSYVHGRVRQPNDDGIKVP